MRQLRQEREWTLDEAAGRMDLDLKHLQKVESANPPLNVTLVTLVRISAAFDVPVATLFLTSSQGDRPKKKRKLRA